MKKKNQDLIYILLIGLLVVLYVLATTNFFTFSYGSLTDWDIQHWSIPDFFRKQFYATGEFFSNFAPNIGDGQNIYYLSYYGYLSPIILLSYLLPFIPMKIYIECISIIGLLASSIMFYIWMRKKYSANLSIIVTLLFMSSAPLLFHSHRHIMYTSYMPFLILAFNEIDNKYIKKKESMINCKLILYIFLIIMNNYFFAVSALFAISIYEFHCIFFYNKGKKITKKIKKEIVNYIIEVLIAILMSAVLLLPTFYVIINGRSKANFDLDFIRLFIPEFSFRSLLYGTYNTGITMISLIALFRNTKSSKYNVLSILLLITIFIPLVSFLLNGTMYTENKVLIPLIPLIIYNTAHYIKILDEKKKVFDNKPIFIALAILFILLNIKDWYTIVVLLEIGSLIFIFKSKRRKEFLIYYIIIVSIVSLAVNTRTDKLELNKSRNEPHIKEVEDIKDKYNYRFVSNNGSLHSVNSIETIDYNIGSIYSSTSNPYYKKYYYNFGNEISQRSLGKITSTKNLLFNIVNGNRYYKSRIKEDALKVARANLKKMSLKEYESLEYPYNMEALYKYVIVDENIGNVFESDINEYKGIVHVKTKGKEYKELEENIYIDLSNQKNYKVKLDDIKKDDLVIIEFSINEAKCPLLDRSIVINGIKNTIPCKEWRYYNNNNKFHYVVDNYSKKNMLDIRLSAGLYNISNIKIYTLDYNKVKDSIKDIKGIDLTIDRKNNNKMYGEYESEKDDILYLQIPYDKGFDIRVNGSNKNYFVVNEGMIGFNISKGPNIIEIEFNAPFLKEAKVISFIGLISWIFLIIYNFIKKKRDI